jgi:starvation-inducible outer membrane lipoprotein
MRKSGKIFTVPAFCAALAGCAAPPQMIYARIDGHIADPQVFETDRTICIGEMHKANMAGVVLSTGNMFEDVANEVGRDQEAATVMVGCMAGRGYKFEREPK